MAHQFSIFPSSGTTWNATVSLASQCLLCGPGANSGGGMWDSINAPDTWNSLSESWDTADFNTSAVMPFWNSTDYTPGIENGILAVWNSATNFWGGPPSGVCDTWNSAGQYWNALTAFWDSPGLPTAQVVSQPVAVLASRSEVVDPISQWNTKSIFWNDPVEVWNDYEPDSRAITQPTITLTPKCTISTEVAQSVHQGTDAIAAKIVLTETATKAAGAIIAIASKATMTDVAQAIHQATDAIASKVTISSEVAQAVHQALITIAPHITLTEVAQMLARGTALLALHSAISTAAGQAIHRASDTLALKAALTEVAQSLLQPSATIATKITLTELATKLLLAVSAVQSRATLTGSAQALHRALLAIVSRTGISASAAAIFSPSVMIGTHFVLVAKASGIAAPVFIHWDDADPMSIAASALGTPVWDDMWVIPVLAPILSAWGDSSTFWNDPAGVWDSARRRD